MRTPTPKQFARAALARAQRISLLKLCRCAWPTVEYDTETGHDAKCPAHARIMGDA